MEETRMEGKEGQQESDLRAFERNRARQRGIEVEHRYRQRSCDDADPYAAAAATVAAPPAV